MTNGQLSPSSLVELPGFAPYPAGSNFLPVSATTLSNLGTPAMAQDYTNLRTAFKNAFGQDLTYAEAYRSLTMQQQRFKEYENGGPLAAYPGTSNHGFAQAMDFRNDVGTYDSATHQWIAAHGPAYGFTSISTEGWHWEHLSDTPVTAKIDTASSGATPLPTSIPKGPDMLLAHASGAHNYTKQCGPIDGRLFKIIPTPIVIDGKFYEGLVTWVSADDASERLILTNVKDTEGHKAVPRGTFGSQAILDLVYKSNYHRNGF